MVEAWKQVEAWLDQAVVWTPEPMERYREILGRLLAGTGMQANLVPDAHLAALAIEHDCCFVPLTGTSDDFPIFAGKTR
jgi:hypothetical protein